MNRRRFLWFKVAVVAGSLLGILLLVEAAVTYRYATDNLVSEHLNWQTSQHVSLLENRARRLGIDSKEQLRQVLEEFREEHADQIAWLRVADQKGEVLAQSGDAYGHSIAHNTLKTLIEVHAQSVSEIRSSPAGEVLVVALPFRHRLRRSGGSTAGAGERSFNVAEVALYLRGADKPFWTLRRNLAVSTAAALALLAAMAVFFLRFPSYLRGRELDQQLALARRVQRELLPSGCPACEDLDFAAECLPAYDVGGDYYAVFRTGCGEIALIVGDVSGKGLSAALLMSLLHGAVRALSEVHDRANLTEMAMRLNQLLCGATSAERFVTLFWAHYDPAKRLLLYVNAGHPPPLLVRRKPSGEFERQRLETGGPVLGLLPKATYEQGEVALRADDLLVLYSDGLAEATNSSDVEFGEERLLVAVEDNWRRPTREIQREIVHAVMSFSSSQALQDDLTLLVARVAPRPEEA